ncbi:MAG: FIMAH domain-containing protein [Thermomicrobiales bacterium]
MAIQATQRRQFSGLRHYLYLALVGVLALLPAFGAALGAAGSSPRGVSAAGAPAGFTDNDFDGIDDTLEQQLAETFAPVIYIEPDESNYPVNVEWFLQRAHLQYHEDCTGDDDEDVPGANPVGSQQGLLGPQPGVFWTHGASFGAGHPDAHCGQDDTGYSHPPHRQITTVATDPDGQVSAGAQTTGYSDQQTFLLPDLPDADHVGSQNPADWVTYFHAYPTVGGGVMLQYWHLFAYNALSVAGFGNHGGDWDATIHVQLGPDLRVQGVWFSRHANDHPGDFIPVGPDLSFVNTTHPLMTIDGGGHAAYASPADFCTHHSVAGGTVSWPTDLSNPLDPGGLRDVVCSPLLPLFSYGRLAGGIVWQTWTGGTVTTAGSLTHPIAAPSGHGGLVNLGEYNPCTPTACYGSQQASTLNAGQFHPLNGQVFIRYSGRWGSLPHCDASICANPPRGPVFQGWDEDTHTYESWYNSASDTPASPGANAWRQPPTTTVALSGPTYTAGGITYLAGQTTIAFSASPNSVAAGFGAARTYYRSYPVGGPAPAYSEYTGPITLPASDGAYQVDYYSLDALNNQEDVRTEQLTRDATPPVVTITQPGATAYPHSATLTLSYTVADGAGSGVALVTPALDGATTLAGHGLASGQAIDLLTELALGPHTLTVFGSDHLGNSTATTVTFTVIVTPESIKDDVRHFVATGDIAPNSSTSLLQKLEAAASARARGDCATAGQTYQAFINELQAQSGKKISPAAVAIVIADAQYLIANCP